MTPGDGMLTGRKSFMANTELHQFVNTAVTCQKSGALIGGVLNTRQEPITIQEGTQYGSFSRICDVTEADDYPWRISVINAVNHDAVEAKKKKTDDKGGNLTKAQKIDRMRKDFDLDGSPCLKSDVQVRAAAGLLAEYWDVFSHDGSYGQTDLDRKSVA